MNGMLQKETDRIVALTQTRSIENAKATLSELKTLNPNLEFVVWYDEGDGEWIDADAWKHDIDTCLEMLSEIESEGFDRIKVTLK